MISSMYVRTSDCSGCAGSREAACLASATRPARIEIHFSKPICCTLSKKTLLIEITKDSQPYIYISNVTSPIYGATLVEVQG